MNRPLKVFVYHAPPDRVAARDLYLRLLQDGADAWLVKEKLLPGQDWKEEIHNAFRDADVIIVCLSAQFNRSEFRQKQMQLAFDAVTQQLEDEICVIPVLLEECDLPVNLQKWTSIYLWENAGYETLVQALQARAAQVGASIEMKTGLLLPAAPGAQHSRPVPEEKMGDLTPDIVEIVEGAGILIEGPANPSPRSPSRHKQGIGMLAALLGFAAIIMGTIWGPAWIETAYPLTPTPRAQPARTPAARTETTPVLPTLKPIATITGKGNISHIVFMIDTSGSMRGQRIRMVRSAASKFLAQLGDEYLFSVVAFDTNVELRLAPARDRAAATEAIQSIDVGNSPNGTCIQDALYAGVQESSIAPVANNTERILILFTDVVVGDHVGWNCGIRYTDESLYFASYSVPIFAIYVGEDFAENRFAVASWWNMEGTMLSAMSEKKIESSLQTVAEAAGLRLNPKSTIPARSANGRPGAMVFVPPGEFIMGENTVALDAFWIEKTEVTNAKYARCMQFGPCMGPRSSRSNTREVYFGNSEFENYPVIHVSWEDAHNYCAWIGGRLPTEAEWEKAARGTDGRPFPWGDEDPSSVGGLSNYHTQDTTEVGSYPDGASPYGALDMAGNVSEWVADWLSMDYYANPPTLNPMGPGAGQYRVWRGGSWANISAEGLLTYSRTGNLPTDSSGGIGFRCARDGQP